MTKLKQAPPPRPPMWYIADDDPDDQLLVCDALSELHIPKSNIRISNDGQQLIDLLREDIVLPGIILLDLNMPVMDGREALKTIKNDAQLKRIPVIIFTTSTDSEEVDQAYEHGGNSYFSKPPLFKDLVNTMLIIKEYWINKAVLPP